VYALGRNERERRRLALQASVLSPYTEQLFLRAGLAPGMRVLDMGCGIGDVAFIAARLVGRHGAVVGVDIDEASLAVARQRARDHDLINVTFRHADIYVYRDDASFDAAVGRHILAHVPDPLKLVKSAFGVLRSGGVVVLQEFDLSVLHIAYPAMPLYEKTFEFLHEAFRKAARDNSGRQIFHLLLEAGFGPPDCRAEYPIDGGPDSPFYEWFAESVKSVLPRAEALGLARAAELDVDTLAERLRQEAVALRSGCAAPAMVGGFARKP
jgi:SAM-dependent methyltransferase